MKSYSVKEIADMLKTNEETVRRWIRHGDMQAIKRSKKEGHLVTESMFETFLKNQPKYASIAATSATANLVAGGIAISTVAIASIVAETLKTKNARVSSTELILAIKQMISTSENKIKDKEGKIKKLQSEINDEKESIAKLQEQIQLLKDNEKKETKNSTLIAKGSEKKT